MADPDIVRLTSVGFVPQQTKALLDTFATEAEAGGGVQPVTIAPLTGITGTGNDAMTGVATITASTSTAATITAPDATYDAANVKTVVDAGLATANTNLLAAANQVVTKTNTELAKVQADLKDLQAKVNAIIAALAP